MHHTSLAAAHAANGAVRGGTRRRNRRFTVKPSRSNKAPIVLGSRRCSQARTFTGPQLGCARRTDRHAPAISSDNDRTRRCGARERDPKAPKHRAIAPQTTCNRPDGSHRTDDRSRQTIPHPPQSPSQNASVHPQQGLLPNHRQAPPRRSSDLLPMSPVQTVTYVSGLDSSPSAEGEVRISIWVGVARREMRSAAH